MYRAMLVFCLAFHSGQVFAELHFLERPGDSDITFYLDKRNPDQTAQPIVLVLQGSDCNTTTRQLTTIYPKVAPGHVSLLIEKYGITADLPYMVDERDDCPSAYLKHNTVSQRVMDVLSVIAELRKTADWWNRELVVIRGSMGAMVATLKDQGMDNLHYLTYEDLDHGFLDSRGKSHQEIIYKDISAWLSTILANAN